MANFVPSASPLQLSAKYAKNGITRKAQTAATNCFLSIYTNKSNCGAKIYGTKKMSERVTF